MKSLPLIFLLFLPFFALSQWKGVDFYAIDQRAISIPVAAPAILAEQLTAPYTKDIEKVRSIFRWIAENIDYNAKPGYGNFASRRNFIESSVDDDTAALKPLNERVAIEVLEKGVAFCDGYSRLFKTLCDYAGVKSELVSGYANGSSRSVRFNSNHRWNAVFIDSTWHLLDVTWASGYMTYYGNTFIRQFNEAYFLSDPKQFYRDHFPEDLRWALLDQPSAPGELKHTPFKTHSFLRHSITFYKPEKGIIEASPGDTLVFEVHTSKTPKKVYVVDTTLFDSGYIASLFRLESFTANSKTTGNRSVCTYVVRHNSPAWISVLYDDEVIMRYRLQMKNNLAAN